jgi:hypothetical protein
MGSNLTTAASLGNQIQINTKDTIDTLQEKANGASTKDSHQF